MVFTASARSARHDRELCDCAVRIDPGTADLPAFLVREHQEQLANDGSILLLIAAFDEVLFLLDGEGVRIAVRGKHLANHPERVRGVSRA